MILIPHHHTNDNQQLHQVWDTPPLPTVLEPHVCEEEKIMVYLAFKDLRNIFGLHKNVHFMVGILVGRSRNG